MRLQTRDYLDVAARARRLGCRVPSGIALLPGNFATAAHAGQFCYHAATPHIRSAWQSVGLEDEGPGAQLGTRDLGLGASSEIRTPVPDPQSLDPVPLDRVPSGTLVPFETASQSLVASASARMPLAVFLGCALLGGPASSLAVALGVASLALSLDPGCASPREVACDVVVERPGSGYTCIEYRGDACGLAELAGDVREVREA